MGDVGIKISKPLFDATTAADFNLLFNSSWPSLPIAVEQTYNSSSTDFSGGTLTYAHNLGYVPFYRAWGVSGGKLISLLNSGALGLTTTTVNTTSITLGVSTTYTTIHLKLYALDIATDVEYPYTPNAGAAVSTYNPDYGIKLVKVGKDISSTDMRDYIIHSRCQSPQVLAVKTQTTATSSTVTYTSPNNYAAWAFGFIKKSNGDYYSALMYSQAYPRLFVTTSNNNYTYSLQYTSGDVGASIVILRDPIFTATNIQATY